MPKKTPVITQDEGKPVEQQILADAIVGLSRAATKLLHGKLNRKAIIVLLAHSAKMPMRDVEIVLDHIQALERTYCK